MWQKWNNKWGDQINKEKMQATKGNLWNRYEKWLNKVEFRNKNVSSVGQYDNVEKVKRDKTKKVKDGSPKNTSRNEPNKHKYENQFAVSENYEENVGTWIESDQTKEVDYFIAQKLQPTPFELWLGVIETRSQAKDVDIICNKVLGMWNWASNMSKCRKGCRIMVGWNSNDAKGGGFKQVLASDFDVTLFSHEHSLFGSTISKDMHDFQYCVNNIEVEDVCSSGFHFTWSKSPQNHMTCTLKKLDRVVLLKDKLKEWQSMIMIDNDPNNSEIKKEGVSSLNKYKEAVADEGKILIQKTKIDWS
ncbi:hypothetical protein Tco_0636187, partial [Tanacetum coccineum]